jgi:hypothetical protein
MRLSLSIIGLLTLVITFTSCKKNNSVPSCLPNATTTRQIVNKQATIKLTATINAVYLVEDGAIDTKLIPCNFPQGFYENDLRVIISGEVKATPQVGPGPCCSENFVITSITR